MSDPGPSGPVGPFRLNGSRGQRLGLPGQNRSGAEPGPCPCRTTRGDMGMFGGGPQ